jgi:CDP-6-deoxy-D-xylo-4-hexulose-3-dehydrase
MDKQLEELLLGEYNLKHPKKKFIAGKTYIPISGQSLDDNEIKALFDFVLENTPIAEGRIVTQFEKELARYMGIRCVAMTNSGSSANLLAIMALTSSKLGSRALQAGDEIITTAVGFPTTINPILQAGCIPVFVDISLSNMNTTVHMVSNAITERTKAIFLAHTLGNVYDAQAIKDLAEDNGLWLIEDCADVLGGEWDGKKVGTFGHISTTSFYPAHMITTIEGGAVFTDNPLLDKLVRSFRDWGRDCWCLPGIANTCGKRFGWKDCGELPDGFDHKYIYSHIGYNLKSTDLQASMGIEQLKKLPDFIAKRRHNWQLIRTELEGEMEQYFILPQHLPKANPSWFGFVLTLRDGCKFTRNELTQYLEEKKIGTRNVFAGNITKQPAYIGKGIIPEQLFKSDICMNNSFWIGVHPGINEKMILYMTNTIKEFVRTKHA